MFFVVVILVVARVTICVIELQDNTVQRIQSFCSIGDLQRVQFNRLSEQRAGVLEFPRTLQRIGTGVANPSRRPGCGRNLGDQVAQEHKCGVLLPEVLSGTRDDDGHLDLFLATQPGSFLALAPFDRSIRPTERTLDVSHQREQVVAARQPPRRPELVQRLGPLATAVVHDPMNFAHRGDPTGASSRIRCVFQRPVEIAFVREVSGSDEVLRDTFGVVLGQRPQFGPDLSLQCPDVDALGNFGLAYPGCARPIELLRPAVIEPAPVTRTAASVMPGPTAVAAAVIEATGATAVVPSPIITSPAGATSVIAVGAEPTAGIRSSSITPSPLVPPPISTAGGRIATRTLPSVRTRAALPASLIAIAPSPLIPATRISVPTVPIARARCARDSRRALAPTVRLRS